MPGLALIYQYLITLSGYEEPGVREAALAMVEEETRRYRPTR